MPAEEKNSATAPSYKVVVKLRGENAEPESLHYTDKNGEPHEAKFNEGNSLARAVALILTLYRRLSAPTLFRVSSETIPSKKSKVAKSPNRSVRGANPIVLILNSHKDLSKAKLEIHRLGDRAQDNLLRLFRRAKGVAQPALELDVASCSPNEVCIEWDHEIITQTAKLETLAATIAAKATPPWKISDYSFDAAPNGRLPDEPEKLTDGGQFFEAVSRSSAESVVAGDTSESDAPLLQVARQDWNSRFLPCLIDSSYLQSAGRAMKSEANSFTDVQNLLRLVGEIVARRKIYLVLATKGPVYPHSRPVVNLINETARHEVIQIIEGERLEYTVIAREVSGRLIKLLPKWFTTMEQATRHSDISPKGGADAYFHSILVSRASNVAQVSLDGRGAQFLAQHILTHPDVIKLVRNRIAKMKGKWTQEDSLRLCSAVRAECYIVLAHEHGFSYQPSLSRYEISLQKGPRHGISEIIASDTLTPDTTQGPSQNDIFLNALIAFSKSEPKEMVKRAAAIGMSLSPLIEEHLTQPKSGDAWDLAKLADQAALLRELRTAYDEVAKNGASGFRLTSFSGAPGQTISQFMPRLAAPLLLEVDGNSNTEMPWRKFLQNCGLRD